MGKAFSRKNRHFSGISEKKINNFLKDRIHDPADLIGMRKKRKEIIEICINHNYFDTGYILKISATPVYPFNTHLCWDHSTYGFIFVRHDDQTKLVITTDKGETDLTNIDLTGVTSKKIQAGWLDINNLWLLCYLIPYHRHHQLR